MKQFLLLLALLLSILAQAGYASVAKPFDKITDKQNSPLCCPVDDFTTFLQNFRDSIEIQRSSTRFPLQMRTIELDTNRKPKTIVRSLERRQVEFPVMPLEHEREVRSLRFQTRQMSDNQTKIALYADEGGYQVNYYFIKDKNWHLVSIEDQSLTVNGKIRYDWIEALFPSASNCTPNGFYYNSETKRSNNGILEKLGYSPYLIDESLAWYRINEKFYGLTAIEIAIPSSTYCAFGVSVSVDVQTLSDALFRKTGNRFKIQSPGFKIQSGTPYLMSKGKAKSLFICKTFAEVKITE